MDLWFGVPNASRVLHNINIRLFADQITYVANHAEDEAGAWNGCGWVGGWSVYVCVCV